MRGLGAPEGIFGDFTVNVAEGTINSFLENLLAFRDKLTNRIFYQKMFPIIAYENGFRKVKAKQELTSSDNVRAYMESELGMRTITKSNGFVIVSDGDGGEEAINPADYEIPSLTWHKTLRPTSNKELMDNLTALAEKGLPAPLRMFAEAAGTSVE